VERWASSLLSRILSLTPIFSAWRVPPSLYLPFLFLLCVLSNKISPKSRPPPAPSAHSMLGLKKKSSSLGCSHSTAELYGLPEEDEPLSPDGGVDREVRQAILRRPSRAMLQALY
jgi:hypothetical protein